ncbi:MAG: hypothetical protein ACK4YF_09745, partial [Exilispira sp.]
MKKKIIIFGVGGTCLDIVEIILRNNKLSNNQYEFIGFLDDNKDKIGKYFLDYPVLGNIEKANYFLNDPSIFFINGIGSSKSYRIRKKIFDKLKISLDRYISLIDPNAVISNFSKIGYGSIIFPNSVIGVNVI